MSDDSNEKTFDFFELFTAILLGLGAIGGAWASYQSGLWGGQSVEAYGKAGTISTQASTVFNTGMSGVIRDLSIDLEAKKQVFEGIYTEDDAVQERTYDVARWLFTTQLSDDGYRALGLPPEPRAHALAQRERFADQLRREREQAARRPQAPPAPAAPGGEQPSVEGEQPSAAENAVAREDDDGPELTPDQMAATFFHDLSEDDHYLDAQLSDGIEMFRSADRTFQEGQRANTTGDEFSYVAVLFTVALFLAGIALVFKSRVKWAFAALGAVTVIVSSIYLFSLERAGGGSPAAPTPSAAEVLEGGGEDTTPAADGAAAAPATPTPAPAPGPAPAPAPAPAAEDDGEGE